MTKIKDFSELGSMMDRFATRGVEEPFDPAYLSDKPYEIPEIDSYEKQFYHKVSIVINKLRRMHITYEWLEDAEVFRVKKFRYTEEGCVRSKKTGKLLDPTRVYSEYPTYMYIAIYDNKEYAFGGEETDMIVSTRISDVLDKVVEWLGNNEPAVR